MKYNTSFQTPVEKRLNIPKKKAGRPKIPKSQRGIRKTFVLYNQHIKKIEEISQLHNISQSTLLQKLIENVSDTFNYSVLLS